MEYQAFIFPKKHVKKGVLKSSPEKYKEILSLAARKDQGIFIITERITEYTSESEIGFCEVIVRKFKGKIYTKLVYATSLESYIEKDKFLWDYLKQLEKENTVTRNK